MNIPFAPPFIDEEVIQEVMDTLKSGWITSGPKVKQLESLMKEYIQMPQCACVNSWTSGAILALKWWGIQPGDEVIVPAYTYAATALSVIHAGGTPVMVDVKEDFTIDPVQLRHAITEKTKVVIPVDFAGWPCDYESIKSILNEPDIQTKFKPSNTRQDRLKRPLLLTDAAHSLGAKYKDRPAGLQADIAVYSFHAVKNITTAEGGLIALNLPLPFDNLKIFEWMKLNSLNGQTKDAFSKIQGAQWRYDIISDGLKINMPDLCAAIGIAQIKQYESKLLPRRKKIIQLYVNGLKNKSWSILPEILSPVKESSYHIFPLRVKNIKEDQRDQIIAYLSNRGISVNVHFIPLPMHTLFKKMGYNIEEFPISRRLYTHEITLPVYPQMTDEQVEYIITELDAALYKIA
jgi:dTDP-4-amino-4,6-dideoxygalactose transaminase